MINDREQYEREKDDKRRGHRRDTRPFGGGIVVTPAPSSNRRQARAYKALMRSKKSDAAKLRAKVQVEIEKKSAEVRKRIADGESLDLIREDLKR